MKPIKSRSLVLRSREYDVMLNRVVGLIEEARRASARTVDGIMTRTYWLFRAILAQKFFWWEGRFSASAADQVRLQIKN